MSQHLDTAESDDALVRRALAGDREAFGTLVRRHQAAALRLAAAVTGSTEEARDIVQEAFVKAYKGLGGFRGDAPVRPWLLRIVANEAKNTRRRHTRRVDRETRHGRLAAAPPAGPDELAARADDADLLLAALATLSDGDREVLACRFVAGMTEGETAAAIGVAVGTVKSRTSRALARLRAVIAPEAAR